MPNIEDKPIRVIDEVVEKIIKQVKEHHTVAMVLFREDGHVLDSYPERKQGSPKQEEEVKFDTMKFEASKIPHSFIHWDLDFLMKFPSYRLFSSHHGVYLWIASNIIHGSDMRKPCVHSIACAIDNSWERKHNYMLMLRYYL